jgi:hypothetical protein
VGVVRANRSRRVICNGVGRITLRRKSTCRPPEAHYRHWCGALVMLCRPRSAWWVRRRSSRKKQEFHGSPIATRGHQVIPRPAGLGEMSSRLSRRRARRIKTHYFGNSTGKKMPSTLSSVR